MLGDDNDDNTNCFKDLRFQNNYGEEGFAAIGECYLILFRTQQSCFILRFLTTIELLLEMLSEFYIIKYKNEKRLREPLEVAAVFL